MQCDYPNPKREFCLFLMLNMKPIQQSDLDIEQYTEWKISHCLIGLPKTNIIKDFQKICQKHMHGLLKAGIKLFMQPATHLHSRALQEGHQKIDSQTVESRKLKERCRNGVCRGLFLTLIAILSQIKRTFLRIHQHLTPGI